MQQKCNGVYSRNNLPEIKDETYVINNLYKSVGTCWTTLYVTGDNMIYFDHFGVEKIPKKIDKNDRKQKYRSQYL